MSFLKKIFIDYTALIFLLPFSYAVGVYVFRNFDILKNTFPFLYFYLFIALAPLYFLFFRPNQSLGGEFIDIPRKLLDRILYHKWAYLFTGFVFSVTFLYMGSIHISTYMARDEWIIQNSWPILPIDLVILPRFAALFVGVFPTDIVVPFVNLLFIILWLCFLIYITPINNYSWIIVLVVSATAFFTDVLTVMLHANFEFNSALICFLGIYGIWRKKYNLGLFLLILGGVFKNTGLFHVTAGVLFLIFELWRNGNLSFGKIRSIFDIPLVVFLGVYLVLNVWGLGYLILVERGSDWVTAPKAEQVFWLSSFQTLIFYMYQNGRITFILAVAGVLFSKENRVFAAFSVMVLLMLRSLINLADGQYAIMFLPVLSYLSLIGILQLMTFLAQPRIQLFLYALLLVFNIYSFTWMILHPITPGGMNRRNSNFDEFIAKLARRFPDDGYIYQKSISLTPYLLEARGGDLDAIRIRPLPEDRQSFLPELSQPGCRLLIVDKDALVWIGITEEDLATMGYSKKPYVLTEATGLWVSYSKECNAWEYD